MYRICDNDNSIGIRKMCSLDDTISYCKKFCFHSYNSNHVMFSFDNRFIMAMNMGYKGSDLIFDTSIRYNNY